MHGDRISIAEGSARVARGLVEVGRGRGCTELGPKQFEYLITREAMTGGQREHLHQVGRAALHPRLVRDGLRIHEHFEASEHPDFELAHTSQPYCPRSRGRFLLNRSRRVRKRRRERRARPVARSVISR